MYEKIKTASEILAQTAANLYDVRHNLTEAAVIAAYDNIKEAKESLDAALSVPAEKAPAFTHSDYLRTDKPYAYLHGLKGKVSNLRWNQVKAAIEFEADLYCVPFKTLYKAYLADIDATENQKRGTVERIMTTTLEGTANERLSEGWAFLAAVPRNTGGVTFVLGNDEGGATE